MSSFETAATLTHDSAKNALQAGLSRIAAGATEVDCAPLKQFDSSALAVVNLPSGLASLARAYGVDALLTFPGGERG